MPSFLTNTAGGKSVATMKAPRSRRGDTNQVASYWAGGATVTYSVATGGTTTTYTSGGKTYKSHILTTGASAFTVVSLGDTPTFDILVVGGGGGGGGTGLGRGFGDGGGGAAGFATTTMALTTGTYQATVGAAGTGFGGAGGVSTFGVGTSLVTANGGTGGSGAEFAYGAGGAGGSASVGGSLGTSNVTTTGNTGRTGGNSLAGQSGSTNTYKDGTTIYYCSTAGSSAYAQGSGPAGGDGASSGAYNGGCGSEPPTTYGSGGVGGHTNCGTGKAGAGGYIVIRYEV